MGLPGLALTLLGLAPATLYVLTPNPCHSFTRRSKLHEAPGRRIQTKGYARL